MIVLVPIILSDRFVKMKKKQEEISLLAYCPSYFTAFPIHAFLTCIDSRRKGERVQPAILGANPEAQELQIRTGSVAGVHPT